MPSPLSPPSAVPVSITRLEACPGIAKLPSYTPSLSVSSMLDPFTLAEVLHKVFREYNQERSDTRTLLLKNKSEIERQQVALQIRHGLGEIDKEVYNATSAHLNDQLTQIHKALHEAERDLSNEKKYIADVIAISCKLGTLWQEGDFRTRQKLQNLVYPNGILYDKHLGSYRTENENEVFRIFRTISTGYIIDKEKAAKENAPLSPLVGMRR